MEKLVKASIWYVVLLILIFGYQYCNSQVIIDGSRYDAIGAQGIPQAPIIVKSDTSKHIYLKRWNRKDWLKYCDDKERKAFEAGYKAGIKAALKWECPNELFENYKKER